MVRPDLWVLQETQEPRVSLVLMDKQGNQGHQERMAPRDLAADQDRMVNQGARDHRVLVGSQVHLVKLEHREHPEHLEILDLKDQ